MVSVRSVSTTLAAHSFLGAARMARRTTQHSGDDAEAGRCTESSLYRRMCSSSSVLYVFTCSRWRRRSVPASPKMCSLCMLAMQKRKSAECDRSPGVAATSEWPMALVALGVGPSTALGAASAAAAATSEWPTAPVAPGAACPAAAAAASAIASIASGDTSLGRCASIRPYRQAPKKETQWPARSCSNPMAHMAAG